MEQKEIIAKSIDQICDMILACDQTGRIIYMNETAQKQLEYPVSDPSISIFDIFPGIFTEAKDLAETRQKAEVDRLPVDIYRYNRDLFSGVDAPFRYWECRLYLHCTRPDKGDLSDA